MPEIKKWYEVEQKRAETRHESQDSQPNQDESAFVLALRWRGHSDKKVHPAKELRQNLDHASPLQF